MSRTDRSSRDCGEWIYAITRAQMRWRMAYRAIYAVRAMLSFLKKRSSVRYSNLSDFLLPPSSASDRSASGQPRKPVRVPEIDHGAVTAMVKEKDLSALRGLGGVVAVAEALGADAEDGIVDDERHVLERREVFGSNTYPKPPPKGFLYFVVDALKDTTILILMACAALSLGFGIKQHGGKEGWYEGGSIFIACFIVIFGSAVSNFRQEAQFDKLSKISDDIKVDVVRSGRRRSISIFEIVVGDVVLLNIGDQIPADGLFLSGHSLIVDESSMTGESDHIDVNSTDHPFLFSGSKVADGTAKMVAVSVGMTTAWGEMMSSINRDMGSERTPLQARLDKLTSSIGKVGLSVASLVLTVMLVRYFTGNTKDDQGKVEYRGKSTSFSDIMNAVVEIVAAAVTIVVVAIPEGLPLAVTLTLAYSMKRMMADQAMVRKLSACETMGSATIICTDKTGTLTLNQMKVTKFLLGLESLDNDSPSSLSYSAIAGSVREFFHQGVGLNTTGSVYRAESSSEPEFSGSPTEKAILSWALQSLGMDMEKVKNAYEVLDVETFNSEKKRSGVMMRNRFGDRNPGEVLVHWKGAAEIIVKSCSSYHETDGTLRPLGEGVRTQIGNLIQGMAASSLRCIAFAYARIPDEEIDYVDEERTRRKLKEDRLTLLGIVGLKDPCRPQVKKAVEACKSAGVLIKMITGDNVFTAKAIAVECGILESRDHCAEGEVVEGVEFRNYTDEERMEKVGNIRVMARSSPLDKLLMVQTLKRQGHVVAVTGDGTNDAPALKEADIGLSMGIQGTEVAKESSDIVILDDNFTSVATVLRWGRCVYNNIQKFIQFQLTVNVAALVINFIAAVSAGEVPLTAVQLLWVNLIMDTLGALALATERPSDELMKKPPVGRTEPLITNVMWRNLLTQSIYQIAVLLFLQFRGESLLNVRQDVNKTLIFNTFVLCQVFNEFNARSMEKKNVFKGVHRNNLFMGIIALTLVLQVVMVEFLKKFASTTNLNWWQWLFCIGVAAVTWPIGWCIKSVPVPDTPFLDYLRRSLVALRRVTKISHRTEKSTSRHGLIRCGTC